MVITHVGNAQYVGASGDVKPISGISQHSVLKLDDGSQFSFGVSGWGFIGNTSGAFNLQSGSFLNMETSTVSLGLPTQTWSIYHSDPITIKARNNISGTTPYSNPSGYINTVLTSIISGITPAGTPTSIEIGEGNFFLGSGMTVIGSGRVGNILIKGQGPGITNILLTSGCARGFYIAGMVDVSGKILVSGATNASLDVTLTSGDANTFASGNYVLLRSDKIWASGMTSQAARAGEIHKIRDVSGGGIRFNETITEPYTLAENSILSKIAMLQNITIEDLKVAPVPVGYTGQTNALFQCDFVDNLQLKNVEVDDGTTSASSNIYIKSCINSDLDVIVTQTGNYPFVELPTTGQYGVYIALACWHVRVKMKARGRWRHPFTGGGINTNIQNAGIPRDIVITGSAETAMSNAFDFHADGDGLVFENCNISALGEMADDGTHNTGGIASRCKNVTIVGCNIRMTTHNAISLSQFASNSVITGNNISKMRKYNAGTQGVAINLDDDVVGCVITGNNIYDCDSLSFGIYGNGGNHDTVITGNVIRDAAPIRFTDSNDCVVTGNRISNSGKRAVWMIGTSDNWVIIGNNARGSSASTLVGVSGLVANNINL